MEERMAAALAQSTSLEAQLESTAAEHQHELAAAAAERQKVEAELAQAVARCSDLAAQVALAQTQAAR